MKKTLFTLAVLLSSALASFAQPASVPDVKSDATDVYQLYVNGGQNGFHFDGWGGATLSEETIGGKKVEKVLDYSKGLDGLPKSDVLKYLLEGNSSVVVRPSGTEPKLKVYISISAASMDKARAVEKQIAEQIEQYMK